MELALRRFEARPRPEIDALPIAEIRKLRLKLFGSCPLEDAMKKQCAYGCINGIPNPSPDSLGQKVKRPAKVVRDTTLTQMW